MALFMVIFLAMVVNALAAGDCDESKCAGIVGPICGSDGQTYTSDCMLKVKNCKSGRWDVWKAKDGSCGATSVVHTPASNKWAAPAAPSVPAANCAITLCPHLDDIDGDDDDLLCGTDGVTYQDECKLWTKNCQAAGKAQVYKKHEGRCLLG